MCWLPSTVYLFTSSDTKPLVDAAVLTTMSQYSSCSFNEMGVVYHFTLQGCLWSCWSVSRLVPQKLRHRNEETQEISQVFNLPVSNESSDSSYPAF